MSSSVRSGSVSSIPPEYESSLREIASLWLDLSEEEVEEIVSSSRAASIAHVLDTLSDHSGTVRPVEKPRDPETASEVDPEDRRAYREFNRAHRDLLRSLRSIAESILDREVEILSPEEMARKAFSGIELSIETDGSGEDRGGDPDV
jgi:hypothetical protein